MAVEISFIRHAETTANRDGIWQGHGDSPPTARGTDQIERLRGRRHEFDLVVSSDLGRTTATATAVAPTFETDATWREADVGGWEGLNREQVWERYRDEVEALRTGERVKLGGGESYDELVARVEDGLDKLVARLDDGERAAVVSHGGVIGAVSGGVLGIRERPRPWPVGRLANTSITTVRVDGDHRQIVRYNDAAHLGGDGDTPGVAGPFISLIRHGRTAANTEGRWAGTTDVPLDEEGRRQAAALAAARDGFAAVYSSPLVRARDTATAIAERHSIELVEHPGVGEMSFGEWEDMHPGDIAARWADEWHSIYRDGNDLPRGGTGETYSAVARRMGRALDDIGSRYDGADLALVSHGGAIRAFITDHLGIPFADRKRLAEPRNTAVSRVSLGARTSMLDGSTDRRLVLVDYNVTAHLDG